MTETLPDYLPENLEPQEYYELGLRYRLGGLVGLAREALTRVTELTPNSSMALKARLVLRGQLPKAPVPEAAEQRNIEAFNLMSSNPHLAKEKFQALMRDFPDFEWPFSNLAWMYFNEGKIDEAKGLAKYLLTVNPEHLRSLHLSMQIAMRQQNLGEALEFVNRARKLVGDSDEEYRSLGILISSQLSGPPPDVIPTDLPAERYFELGEIYSMLGRFSLSREALELVLKNSTNEVLVRRAKRLIETELPNEMSHEAELKLAEASKLSTTDPEEANRMMEQAVTDFPNLELPALSLAIIATTKGNTKKAERFIRICLKRNPNYRNAKTLLIHVYLMDERFDSALQIIESEGKLAEPDDMTYDLLKAQCQIARYQAGK